MERFEFEAIGTHWVIDSNEDISPELFASIRSRVRERIDLFDRAYSRFRADSLVSQMARLAGEYELPPDAEPMMDLYHELYGVTGGKFTPLIGQTLSDAGYDAEYSLREKSVTRASLWEEVLKYSFPKLTLKRPALLDFGAAGKGYLVDIVSELIHEAGVASFCVDAGGDMRHESESGTQLEVALENPHDPSIAIGTVTLGNASLCGSAGNRRAWGNYHHVIDPDSVTSPRHIAALWVRASTTLLADAMTTALYFVSPDMLRARYTFEYLILYSDNSIEQSEGFGAELFT